MDIVLLLAGQSGYVSGDGRARSRRTVVRDHCLETADHPRQLIVENNAARVESLTDDAQQVLRDMSRHGDFRRGSTGT
jgi:hypothetical protein